MKARSGHGPWAVVLAAHGSRRDPDAAELVRRHALALKIRPGFDEVAVAFHQGEPSFSTVLDGLRADRVVVVPFMTSAGHFSQSVLPNALKSNRRYSHIRLRQTRPVGTHPGVASLIARRVGELLSTFQLDREATSVVVVGHGTSRHDQSRASTVQLVQTLSRRRVAGEVLEAFLDDEPNVANLSERLTRSRLLIVPFLIGGDHAAQDLPRLLGFEPTSHPSSPLLGRCGGRSAVLDAPLGNYGAITDLVAELALQHVPPLKAGRHPGVHSSRARVGRVHLVGAGPGDPDLITVRGSDLLRRADVIVHDRLVGHTLLGEARAGAEVIDAGKRPGDEGQSQQWINDILIDRARQGLNVVRLKGGDPMVFGRGGEELAACRAAGVPCTVVPGVTSAIAAPAAAGIPVTLRGVGRSFAVITGHLEEGAETFSPASIASVAGVDTVVVLMGRANLGDLVQTLIRAGRDPATPAACIQEGTTERQRVAVGTLGSIADVADREGLCAPMVTVIGSVAAYAGRAPC